MAIDYRRLLSGLGAMSDLVAEMTGLPAVELLLNSLQEATGAGGTTFVEYTPEGTRVVLATGAMSWAAGQRVLPPNRYERDRAPGESPWSVDLLHPVVASALRERGLVAFTGTAVFQGDDNFAAINLFFPTEDVDDWADVQLVLRLAGQVVRHVYHPPTPTSPGAVVDAEDRALFLAVAGHELRTPVTVVKGYASMLANRWDSLEEPDRREAARVLAVRADELARLVDRLLRASVGDGTGGWLVRTVPFNPAEALIRAVSELPQDLRRPLRLHIPDSLPMALGDPRILTSVVAELVTNAVRSTPTPPVLGPAVPAATTAAPVELEAAADAQTVMIRVCDRGVGIDPAEAAVAFDRFWRSSRAGDTRPGVGLGLYLVRRLVERQNGWVSLRPREGGGTVAEIRLHRADGPPGRPSPGEV